MKPLNKIAIIGVGLLGGSLGLAIKKKMMAKEIVGFFRSPEKIPAAIKKGAIDRGATDLADAVSGADLIILSTPVSDIIAKLKVIKKIKSAKDALVTDTGSTKAEIVRTADGLNFIGAHPLAGSEHSGISNAHGSLFKNSLCILTPTRKNDKKTTENIRSFWEALGARTRILDAKTHDSLLSQTSHLPHAVAFSLIDCLPEEAFAFCGGGLRDTTRIAASSPDIWADIFLDNKKNVLRSLASFERSLSKLKKTIKTSDRKNLLAILSGAQHKRQRLITE